jgi:hypothetical protein
MSLEKLVISGAESKEEAESVRREFIERGLFFALG